MAGLRGGWVSAAGHLPRAAHAVLIKALESNDSGTYDSGTCLEGERIERNTTRWRETEGTRRKREKEWV